MTLTALAVPSNYIGHLGQTAVNATMEACNERNNSRLSRLNAHWQLRNPHGIKELRYLLVRVFGNGYNLLCLIS